MYESFNVLPHGVPPFGGSNMFFEKTECSFNTSVSMCPFDHGSVVVTTSLTMYSCDDFVNFRINESVVLHPWFEWTDLTCCCESKQVGCAGILR